MTSWVDVCQMVQRRGEYRNTFTSTITMKVLLWHLLSASGAYAPVKGIETPLNVQLPAVIEPTLFDISPN